MLFQQTRHVFANAFHPLALFVHQNMRGQHAINPFADQFAQHIPLLTVAWHNATVEQHLNGAKQHPFTGWRFNNRIKRLQPFHAKPAIQMPTQRIDDIANFHPVFVKLRTVPPNRSVRPLALRVKPHVNGVCVVQRAPLGAIGVNGDGVGHHSNKRTKLHPEINTLLDCPIVEGKQPQHVKIQIVGAIANFIQIVQPQTMLNVRNRFRHRRQEGGFVFLHPRSGEQSRRIGGKDTVVDSERQRTQQTKLLVQIKYGYIAWRGDMASSSIHSRNWEHLDYSKAQSLRQVFLVR